MKQDDTQEAFQDGVPPASAWPLEAAELERRRLRLWLGLARAYAFGLPALGVLCAALGFIFLAFSGFAALWPWGLIALGVLMALAVVDALRQPLAVLPGYGVDAAQAPELFRMLGKIKSKLQAASIHQVVLVEGFVLEIVEQRQFDFWGRKARTLYIGLPFLASASPERMLALIAQEYAYWREGARSPALELLVLRRAWSRKLGQRVNERGLRRWVNAPMNALRRRVVAGSCALARQGALQADHAAAKIYGRSRMAEALLENAIVAHHIAHEHWRQYWQQANKYARPALRPYAWLAAWQIKPPAARAVQERFSELMREEGQATALAPTTRQRVRALGRKIEMPQPSPRHAGVLLGRAFGKAVKQFDEVWWKTHAQRWQVLHLQARQELEKMGQMQARMGQLSIAELERLAQLYQRHLYETDAEMVYRRIRALEPYNAAALWQQIEIQLERHDENALLALAEMVDRYPERQHRAVNLALGILEKLPQTVEVQELHRAWLQRLQHCQAQEQAWQRHLQDTPPLLELQEQPSISAYEREDFALSAQRVFRLGRAWVREKKRPNAEVSRCFVVLLEAKPEVGTEAEVDKNAQTKAQEKMLATWSDPWMHLAAELDLPGQIICLDLQRTQKQHTEFDLAAWGPADYDAEHQAFRPALF